MLRFKVGLLIITALYFTLASNVSSEEKNQPKIKIRRSRLLLEGDKRYLDDIEWGEKKYVGDRSKEDIELRRYKGWEKKYAGEESEKEFFERETEALYKFTSLQKNIESAKDEGEKSAIIVNEEEILANSNDAKVEIEEKEKSNLKKKRKKIPIPKVIIEE